jgi:hypothetical protein
VHTIKLLSFKIKLKVVCKVNNIRKYEVEEVNRQTEENEPFIEVPIYSEDPDEFGDYELIGHRKEYI